MIGGRLGEAVRSLDSLLIACHQLQILQIAVPHADMDGNLCIGLYEIVFRFGNLNVTNPLAQRPKILVYN